MAEKIEIERFFSEAKDEYTRGVDNGAIGRYLRNSLSSLNFLLDGKLWENGLRAEIAGDDGSYISVMTFPHLVGNNNLICAVQTNKGRIVGSLMVESKLEEGTYDIVTVRYTHPDFPGSDNIQDASDPDKSYLSLLASFGLITIDLLKQT